MNTTLEKNTIKEYIKLNNLEHILPDSIIDIIKLCHFNTDDLIVEENTPVEYLYLLLEGKARVSPASEDGKVGLLAFVIAMDVIGDLEYFSNDPYYYNVTALLPCVALAVPVKSIDTFFNHNVNFYRFICENMASKMKRTSFKYSKTLLYPVKNQIANYFFELYIQSGKTTLPIGFKETAEFFDITPRYLRSVLVELESEGVVSRESIGVRIVSMAKLKEYKI